MIIEKLIKTLNKPEYLFRPSQILRRIQHESKSDAPCEVLLPWGLRLQVHPNETIGRSILNTGLHDLSTVELIFRLLKPGDLAVDGGANIGLMTCAMLARVGGGGKVEAFEVHPEIFAELQQNIQLWGQDVNNRPVTAHRIALSNENAIATMHVPEEFEENRGIAYLSEEVDTNDANSVEVPTSTLDAILKCEKPIKLLKLDVEGHELQVLQGARSLLKEKLITHIIFEEHGQLPTPTTDYLEDFGYMLFKFEKGLLRPKVVPARPGLPNRSFESPSYLATLEPKEAMDSVKKLGWKCLAS